MTPLFQAIFACGLASARYARLRSTTRPSIPNLQKRIYTTNKNASSMSVPPKNLVRLVITALT